MSIEFRVGDYIINGFNRVYSRQGPIGDSLSILQFVPNRGNNAIDSLDAYCIASTVWESMTTRKYRVNFEMSAGRLFIS